MLKWQNERERKLKLTKEERRKEYKRDHIPVDDVIPWKDQLAKLPEQTDTKALEKTKKKCLYDIKMKEMDLTDKVATYIGDITKLEVDAIVNAANSSLMGGGGVDGAIHRAAGPLLKKENLNHDGCPTGEAVLSGGYDLPARYIISTVGPQGENPRELANCYKNSLQMAISNQIKTVAFPCISTGIYGYPNEDAALVALKTVRKFLEEHSQEIDRVIFCLFLEVDVSLYHEYMPILFPKLTAPPPKKKSEKIDEMEENLDDLLQPMPPAPIPTQ
eukprot:TRINITY_DN37738_c0_g3_i1.p1 TRINITY_DN37738_c0_g3~~TRINITY_DN37738_c0_g3_i1.p1  ORF type:complete len:316 (-),score=82.93 TRINITY_DN37738_c0_g3_i1:302-1123(-)